MPAKDVKELIDLYRRDSKHSAYQMLAPSVARVLGNPPLEMRSRHEVMRMECIQSRLALDGARVLDIGGNTGFFTFSAIEQGAASVDYYEGNPAHANFVAVAARTLGLEDRVKVHAGYFDFDPGRSPHGVDICFCLNVIHHFGDDFGDRASSIDRARAHMIACINALAKGCDRLVLQLGFNWKGDIHLPLFELGLKREMIAFVSDGTGAAWEIEATHIAEETGGKLAYAPVTESNLQRDDRLGEFLNRPLFFMKSRRQ